MKMQLKGIMTGLNMLKYLDKETGMFIFIAHFFALGATLIALYTIPFIRCTYMQVQPQTLRES